MKILVFMSDNRKLDKNFDTAEYNSLTTSINYEYCKKYNYDFIYYRPYLDDSETIKLYNCIDTNNDAERHAAWSKILSTSLALELNYDWVVYIDSDCIFKNFDQSLEDFIKPYIEKNIIFLNDKPWNYYKPNSGFFACNVSNITKEIMRDWYCVDIPTNNKIHPWEQNALRKIYLKYDVKIVDSWMFKETDDQFLRHLCHIESKNRISYFKDFIITNKIDHSKNIGELKYIIYDTNKHKFVLNNIKSN